MRPGDLVGVWRLVAFEESEEPDAAGPPDDGPPGEGPYGEGPPGEGPPGDGPYGDGPPGDGPLGPRPEGRLVYTGDGHVAVHMMRGGRPHAGAGPAANDGPAPAAYDAPDPVAYMGYAGTWRLEGSSRVVHRIEVTPRADWVGTEQVREATLTDGLLTLHARTVIAGTEHHRVLVWRRDTARGLHPPAPTTSAPGTRESPPPAPAPPPRPAS
ncbi:lipocalin-like domain-containing protein [Streptomyces sp. NPDC059785]|uniref:lipocalin-like domain-containing protein n=1 Tax=Streptomyces sp. NPDC059785 TaxID=3346945 RepID=UPI0036553FEE